MIFKDLKNTLECIVLIIEIIRFIDYLINYKKQPPNQK